MDQLLSIKAAAQRYQEGSVTWRRGALNCRPPFDLVPDVMMGALGVLSRPDHALQRDRWVRYLAHSGRKGPLVVNGDVVDLGCVRRAPFGPQVTFWPVLDLEDDSWARPSSCPSQGEPSRRHSMSAPPTNGLPPTTPAVGQDRPRLAVIEGFTFTTPLDPYLSLRALAAYSGCSVRWLRDRLTDPHHPLPCYRLPSGKILVRRSEFDAWMAGYRRVGNPEVESIVAEVMGGLQ